MASPLEALGTLRSAADDGRLDALCAAHGVRLLGVFGSVVGPHNPDADPHDIDVAVSLEGPPQVVPLLDELTSLTDCDTIDLVVIDGASPVLRAEAMCGLGLYENEAGLWARTQMSALAERRDTQPLRDLDLRALAG
jgi:predicted nucleotidyltransferase